MLLKHEDLRLRDELKDVASKALQSTLLGALPPAGYQRHARSLSPTDGPLQEYTATAKQGSHALRIARQVRGHEAALKARQAKAKGATSN